MLPIQPVSNAALQHLLCPGTQGQSSSSTNSLTFPSFFCFKEVWNNPAHIYFILLLFRVSKVFCLSSGMLLFLCRRKRKSTTGWHLDAYSASRVTSVTNQLDSFVSHTAYNLKNAQQLLLYWIINHLEGFAYLVHARKCSFMICYVMYRLLGESKNL